MKILTREPPFASGVPEIAWVQKDIRKLHVSCDDLKPVDV